MDPSPLPEDPLADVPELTTYLATTDDDKIAALKLVADSVAQMRQNANNTLVWHPLNLAVGVALLALVARYTYEARQDKTVTALTCAGIIMIFLASFRYLTQGYLFAAEGINWEWLGDADVIVTKFGEEVIGTVVVQWVSGDARGKRKKAWRGEVIGWTVRLRYRKKGVGGALLEEAVREARMKGPETTIEFAKEHASTFSIPLQPLLGRCIDYSPQTPNACSPACTTRRSTSAIGGDESCSRIWSKSVRRKAVRIKAGGDEGTAVRYFAFI